MIHFLTEEEEELIADVTHELQEHFQAAATELPLDLRRFQLLHHYKHLYLKDAFRVADHGALAHVALVKVAYDSINGKYSSEVAEYQTYGIVSLGHSFGRTTMHTEGLAERIKELLKPKEVDFADDPAFSQRFYVLSDSPDAVLAHLSREHRQALMKLEDKSMECEFIDDTLVFCNRRLLSIEQALKFASVVRELASLK